MYLTLLQSCSGKGLPSAELHQGPELALSFRSPNGEMEVGRVKQGDHAGQKIQDETQ